MLSFPRKINKSPIPATNPILAVLSQTKEKASFAAAQKFLPVIAI